MVADFSGAAHDRPKRVGLRWLATKKLHFRQETRQQRRLYVVGGYRDASLRRLRIYELHVEEIFDDIAGGSLADDSVETAVIARKKA